MKHFLAMYLDKYQFVPGMTQKTNDINRLRIYQNFWKRSKF
jgi:hypothetical protein